MGEGAGGQAVVTFQRIQNGAIDRIEEWLASAFPGQRDAKAATEFFQEWFIQPRFQAGAGHALDAASPLLDQPQFVENAADDPVAQSGDAPPDVFRR